MSVVHDISVALRPGIPIWPGSVGFRVTRTFDLDAGDPVTNSRLDCDVHVGTHLDAPSHHLQDGCTVDRLPLDTMIGPVFVADLPDVDRVTAGHLESLHLPLDTSRLLLHTRNSLLWTVQEADFQPDYVALTTDAARWVVQRGIRLIGIDYLSIQRYTDGPLTHRILMEAEVVILEGLNLDGVPAGFYDLICLPLRLVGAEGAPARAVLLPLTRRNLDPT